jgi:hypothetical protein
MGSDDYKTYFARFVWTAQETVYRLRVTSFESVNTGEFSVTQKWRNIDAGRPAKGVPIDVFVIPQFAFAQMA